MIRRRLTIGTFGEIGHLASPNGRVAARARYRDWDGKTRLVQATGDTRKSAERALRAKEPAAVPTAAYTTLLRPVEASSGAPGAPPSSEDR